jgi:hypothetical protein
MRVSNDIKPGPRYGIAEGESPSEGWSLWRRKLVLSTVLTLMVSVPYYGNQHWPLFPATVMEPTAIDRAIPFVEGTSWIYLSYFLLLPIAVIAIPTSRDMNRFALDVAFIAILSSLVFMFYPTAVERPSGPATDLAYRLVLAVDAPTNACPSLHASLGLYSALWCHRLLAGWRAAWLWRAGLWAWTTGILYATLALRQHVLADLLAGGSLAAVVYAMSGRWSLWRHIGHALFTPPRSALRTTNKSAG